MKIILKPIFEWLVGNYNLFENPFYNNIAMVLVGVLAFRIAWKIVGKLYHNGSISGRGAGSIIHWIIRFIAFTVIFMSVSITIWIIKFIISIPLWVWYSLLGISAVITFLYVFRSIIINFIKKNYVKVNDCKNEIFERK